ncbi:MAG TPA: hypothetical protein VNH19_17760 [Candidatus Limnocylindrales bacterium]|nr:hypothetical protein [Candidatus Limnocylindrales bacterium]
MNALTRAGCDREILLSILGGGIPSLRSWGYSHQSWLPRPKYWLALAKRVERASNEIETTAEYVGNLSNEALKSISIRLGRELKLLASAYRMIAGGHALRHSRSISSYRNMGKLIKPALLCHYVKKTTKKPHFREISDLLSAVDLHVMAEDALRHQVERAIPKLNFNKHLPPLLDLILVVLNSPKKSGSGHE